MPNPETTYYGVATFFSVLGDHYHDKKARKPVLNTIGQPIELTSRPQWRTVKGKVDQYAQQVSATTWSLQRPYKIIMSLGMGEPELELSGDLHYDLAVSTAKNRKAPYLDLHVVFSAPEAHPAQEPSPSNLPESVKHEESVVVEGPNVSVQEYVRDHAPCYMRYADELAMEEQLHSMCMLDWFDRHEKLENHLDSRFLYYLCKAWLEEWREQGARADTRNRGERDTSDDDDDEE